MPESGSPPKKAKVTKSSTVPNSPLDGGKNPLTQLAAQNSEKIAQQNEKYKTDFFNSYNDFSMNNDYLGENTLSPAHEVSGLVWTNLPRKNPDFFNPNKKETITFVIKLHAGKDIHEIYMYMESFTIAHY